MQHVFFVSYLLAFSLGLASLFVVLAIYLQYRRKEILYYLFLLVTWMLFFVVKLVHVYLLVFFQEQTSAFAHILILFFFLYGTLFIIIYPPLIHSLLGIPFGRIEKSIFFSIDFILPVVLGIIMLFFSHQLERFVPFFTMLVTLMLIYGLVVFLTHRKELGSHFFKKSIEIFFFIQFFLIFTGFFTNNFIDPKNPFFSSKMYDVLFLFGFFLFHLFNLYFSFRYFNTPSYMENGKLTEYFLKTFGFSDREGEIIASICKGSSNSETAKKLFISQKTVETHLYNIFQKAGVKNRTQLINLLYSKKTA